MKISFRTRTTRYLTFKFHRMASAMKEDTRILRATQKWNETYTQTHKRSKTKTIDEDFLQSRQKFAWIKIRHHWHSDIKFPPPPKKEKKKKKFKATNMVSFMTYRNETSWEWNWILREHSCANCRFLCKCKIFVSHIFYIYYININQCNVSFLLHQFYLHNG